jgi:hypothetical protein
MYRGVESSYKQKYRFKQCTGRVFKRELVLDDVQAYADWRSTRVGDRDWNANKLQLPLGSTSYVRKRTKVKGVLQRLNETTGLSGCA